MRARLRFALATFLAFWLTQPAQSNPDEPRLVAIVFDTSGSMQGRYRLPSFGTRLLAATIDGRAGFDRLLAMNFKAYQNEFGVNWPDQRVIDAFDGPLSNNILSPPVTNEATHQRIIDSDLVAAFSSLADSGTPYGPIEVMLNRVAREVESTPTNEDVIFIVVSDGHYSEVEDELEFKDGSQVPTMRQSFQSYRNRIEAAGSTLRAEFLFIDVADEGELVKEQGVRDTLLEVFNGDQHGRQGAVQGVTSADQLWDALKDIIAWVAGTDRAAQEAYITYSGRTVEVESPLSISRVVIVSTAAVGTPLPERQSDTFDVQPTDDRRLTVEMSGTDSEFGSSPQREGLVEHLWFQNAVPPGTYSLTFTAPVDRDVFLLFETRSIINLRVFNEDGTEVPAGPNGTRTLYQNRTYHFQSQVLDGETTPLVVDLDTLPQSLTMQLTLSGPGSDNAHSMEVYRTRDFGQFTWRPTELGEFSASSRASAGILSPASPRIALLVVDPVPDLALSPLHSSTPCSTCAEGEVASAVEVAGGAVQVGEFDVTADGTLDGAITFDPSVLPPGFQIRDPNGNAIRPGQQIPFAAQETRRFALWREGDIDAELLADGVAKVAIAVAPTGAWQGPTIEQAGAVLLSPPEMGLILAALSNPITPGQLDGLMVPDGELVLGEFAAQFSLVDVLQPPSQETIGDQVTVESNRLADRFVNFGLSVPDPSAVGFNALAVTPDGGYWCLCWIWVENGFVGSARRQVEVQYRAVVRGVTLQQASAMVPMEFPVRRTQGILSCIWNLCILILLYMLLRGIWALIFTHRFPKESRIEIVEPDERVRFVRLDKGNTVWLKAWIAAIIGNPDEQRVVEGLRLKSTRNGALLDISRGNPNWQLERLGDSFAELRELSPKKSEYKIQWDDCFESIMPPGRTLYLRKGRRN